MKTKLILAFLLFFSIVSIAQIQDLARLADGELILQRTLRDGDNKLYGYFFLYEKNIGIDSVTMEYVLLDKNLNKALNGTLTEPRLSTKVTRSYYDCSLMGRKLVIDRLYEIIKFGGIKELLLNTFQFIDLDSNQVGKEFKCVDGQFTDLAGEFDQEVKENKALVSKSIINVFTGDSISGFLVNNKDRKNRDHMEKDLQFYDVNKNFKWTFTYNPEGEPRNYYDYRLITTQGNTIYLGLNHVQNMLYQSYSIVALDMITGAEKYRYKFDSHSMPYQRNFLLREIDGQLNILGSYTNRLSLNTGYDFTKSLGFYRIRLDSAGNELESKHHPWINYSQHLTINDKGYDAEGFKLMPRQIFVFKSGKISILTERYKPFYKGQYIPLPIIGTIVQLATQKQPRTDDFVMFNFDREMNLLRLDTIPKELSKNNTTDFHFSEYINDREGVVFFYVNSFKVDKEKQVVLGINTMINGEITEEKIPLYSKKEYAIYPMPAKDGYVMLREVNEKEKLNQIRLEKLNYDAL